jgi:hypothetical protein
MTKIKIAVYIVTYKSEEMLKNNIESLLQSKNDINKKINLEINVINNYTKSFSLNNYLSKNTINVFHNFLRPDFSTGHLSRNWNQGLLHGFEDLKNPKNDLVCLVQDDSLFLEGWCDYIIEQHQKYDFISFGGGDQFHSYKADHIKKVGLWDERFSNIGYQEADYYIRSYIHNKEKSSINDHLHYRVHNELGNKVLVESEEFIGYFRGDDRHTESLEFHENSQAVLMHKWGKDAVNWKKFTSSKIKDNNYYFLNYPYFEKDIYLDNFRLPKKRLVSLGDVLINIFEKTKVGSYIYEQIIKRLLRKMKKLRN